MGIIFGFLSLLCLCLLLAKIVTKKCYFEKADRFLMKSHKYLCSAFMVFCIAHIAFVIPVLQTRNGMIPIVGIIGFSLFLFILISYHRTKGKHGGLSIAILIFVVIHVIVYYFDFYAYRTKIQEVNLQEINTSMMADGQYIGEYDAGYIYAKVQVTIFDGNIQAIEILEHRNERGVSAEKIVNDIVALNKFPVDAISGATNSSKVIQQAVQNAFK